MACNVPYHIGKEKLSSATLAVCKGHRDDALRVLRVGDDRSATVVANLQWASGGNEDNWPYYLRATTTRGNNKDLMNDNPSLL